MVQMTQQGFDKLIQQLHDLEAQLRSVRSGKGEAAEVGGNVWHDNFSFEQAEREERALMGRISDLQLLLAQSEIVTVPDHPTQVQVGIAVTLCDLEDHETEIFGIVGPGEADPEEGRISYLSPMGALLLGAREGEVRDFTSPGGMIHRFRVERIWKEG